MVCEYEFKVTVTLIILAIIARYIIYKYVPKKYFYDKIEIKQCKRYINEGINITKNDNESQDSCMSCNNYKRINDIDTPYL